MKITYLFIEQGKSDRGGWSDAQIHLLGEDTKIHGWKRRLIGKEISEETATEFLSLKNIHLKKANPNTVTPQKGILNRFEPVSPNMPWKEQYLHPNWQKMRLAILKRDFFRCVNCRNKDKLLHVHHLKYIKGKMIWDVPKYYLVTLCEDCHSEEHGRDLRAK